MSLINDALKRAQSEVDRGRTSPLPVVGLSRGHTRSHNQGSWVKFVFAALVIGASAWAFILFASKDGEVASAPPQVVKSTESVATSSSQNVAATEVQSRVESVADAEPPPIDPVVAAPVVAGESSPVVVEQPAADIAAIAEPSTKVETVPEALAAPLAAEAPAAVKAEPVQVTQSSRDEIVFTLKQLEITAVMGDGKQARIMSGGQIHRAGELINLDLKIRFEGKKESMLYFSDPAGEIYEKAL